MLYEGSTVGYNRIAVLNKTIFTDNLSIVIDQCRFKPYIEHISVYESDGYNLKAPFFKRLLDK